MWFFSKAICKSKARLDGKTVIVTGSNTGIGKAAATEFIRRGARVILACRDEERAERARSEIMESVGSEEGAGMAVVMKLDLASLSSVNAFAQKILDTEERIDILVNNAGMIGPYSQTEDGFEVQFQTNHLGHFLLTLLLLPRIIATAPARIINVSSLAYSFAYPRNFDNVRTQEGYYGSFTTYARTKLANILFTRELAKRLKGKGVTTYSLHPGVVRTEISRYLTESYWRGLIKKFVEFLFYPLLMSPEEGAQTILHCALDEDLVQYSGLFYQNCQEQGTYSIAQNDELAKDLWDKSISFTNLSSFDPFRI